MKVHRRKIFRVRRYLAVLACTVSILALPAIASARPSPADPPTQAQSTVFHPSPSERVTDYRAPDWYSAPEPTVNVTKQYDGRALSIALAGSALLVALLGGAYVLVRLHGFSRTPASRVS
jgi:hypothetical protein